MECPTCGSEMIDDGVNAWCVQADCDATKTIPLERETFHGDKEKRKLALRRLSARRERRRCEALELYALFAKLDGRT